MRKFPFPLLYLVPLISLLVACTPSIEELLGRASQLTERAGFERTIIDSGQFQLVTFSRFTDTNAPLTFYIEGDGHAFVTPSRISKNPTPHNPIGLQLAASDTRSKNIVYIARPCHYHIEGADPGCSSKYWVSHRYSESVVASLNGAVEQLQLEHGFPRVELVGFSGGGALALLIASRRSDVISIRTVAANIDTQAFNELHRVSNNTVSGSLNPVTIAASVSAIAQNHFVGMEDDNVPRLVAESFVKHLPDGHCAKIIDVEDTDHFNNWQRLWPQLLEVSVGSC